MKAIKLINGVASEFFLKTYKLQFLFEENHKQIGTTEGTPKGSTDLKKVFKRPPSNP